ncbi:MAG: radical SAM protein [Coriobacteriia bacterium]
MLDFVSVRTGAGQPVACRRCAEIPDARTDDGAAIAAALDAVLAGGGSAGAPDVLFSGGEPLALDEFVGLLETARTAGSRRIGAVTGAAPLNDADDAAAFVREGLRHLHVPLLAPDAASHDALLGSAGFDAALAGMRAFRAAGADQGVRTALYGWIPVCTHTAEDLPETVSVFAREGATAVALHVPPETDARRIAPWLVAAFETGLTNGVWVWIESVDPAALGPAAMAVYAPVRVVEVGA